MEYVRTLTENLRRDQPDAGSSDTLKRRHTSASPITQARRRSPLVP
jgi:hypothetical protein